MRNKLFFLTAVSLKRKIKTKWFVIANILLIVGLACILNADSIIQSFGGDFDQKTEVYVLDKTSTMYDEFTNQLAGIEDSFNQIGYYTVKKYDKEEEELKEFIADESKKIGVIFDKDEGDKIKAKIISDGYIDTIPYQILSTAMKGAKTQIALKETNIPIEELNKIYGDMEIEREILDESKKSEEESMETILSTVFPIIILPFFMLTIFLVQMIGAEVNDEKTTRGMEIIISNVSPKAHFFSKLLAGNIFVILQGILLLVYSGIGLLIRSIIGKHSDITSVTNLISNMAVKLFTQSFVEKLIYLVPLTLILMILTFIAYSILAGVFASITTNTEDFQQLQTPIMVVLVIGYYLAVMASTFKGALFIRILSYVPLISAILSPSLLVLGQIGIIDVILSIIIMIIANYLLIHYGLRVYKVGILNYSSEGLWRKMFHALKNKNV